MIPPGFGLSGCALHCSARPHLFPGPPASSAHHRRTASTPCLPFTRPRARQLHGGTSFGIGLVTWRCLLCALHLGVLSLSQLPWRVTGGAAHPAWCVDRRPRRRQLNSPLARRRGAALALLLAAPGDRASLISTPGKVVSGQTWRKSLGSREHQPVQHQTHSRSEAPPPEGPRPVTDGIDATLPARRQPSQRRGTPANRPACAASTRSMAGRHGRSRAVTARVDRENISNWLPRSGELGSQQHDYHLHAFATAL